MKKILHNIKYDILDIFTSVNTEAILVFGNQKAGTSVISKLLSEYSGKSLTLDTSKLWEPNLTEILEGNIHLSTYLNKNSYAFSKDIIKEPNLTYFLNDLLKIFNNGPHILIIRNPHQNIRSILNRLDIPGNLKEINYDHVPFLWRHIFNEEGGNYIEKLSKRWNKFYDINPDLLKHLKIIKYEDFLEDKLLAIKQLSAELNVVQKNKIDHLLNVQFQPQGDRNVPLKDFFGENFRTIENTCSQIMHRYGY